MTPQQLIDACRATNQPLPSGKKIAEVVERARTERHALASLLQRTGYYLDGGCKICGDSRGEIHAHDCPVGMAERILKEAS